MFNLFTISVKNQARLKRKIVDSYPRAFTVYKLYVRSHLDYGDIIYYKHDPEFKLDFTKMLESTQYSTVLAVTGVWRGTNTDRLYKELG